MNQTPASPIIIEEPQGVPGPLRRLHDEAVGAFLARDYRRALPLLGRLALALPVGHGLRPTVRGSLARTFLELGNLGAARRELGHARAAEPRNRTFRLLETLLRRAEQGRAP